MTGTTADTGDAAGIGHNSEVGAQALNSFVERLERLDDEIRSLNAGKSDIYAEAKARGFDPNAIRWVLNERRMDPEKRRTRDEIRDMYARALGLRA